jgi:hypothetical protein
MVAFPGQVAQFRVVALSETRRGPYRIPSLRDRVKQAEGGRDEQYRAFSEFRQANYDDLLRVQRRLTEDPGAQLDGRLLELRERWEAFREERSALVAGLREAEQELELEIRRVQKSLQREADPEYLTGETLEKDATARVSTKDKGEGTYVVTLTRYDVKNAFGAVVPTRWIVTAVGPAR